METKICNKCGRELPLSEFHKCKSSKDGLQRLCKKCIKQYNQEHNEEKAEYHKKWYEDNKEKFLDYQKQWYKEHKEEKSDKHKQYYSTLKGYCISIRSGNLIADKKAGRIAYNEDPLPPLEYYMEQFEKGIDFYDGKKYPFNELGFDRIDNSKPHTIDNIVVCTGEHNIQRGKKSFDEFFSLFNR